MSGFCGSSHDDDDKPFDVMAAKRLCDESRNVASWGPTRQGDLITALSLALDRLQRLAALTIEVDRLNEDEESSFEAVDSAWIAALELAREVLPPVTPTESERQPK